MQNKENAKLLERYKRYSEDILLDIDSEMLRSEQIVAIESLRTLHRNEYHYHLVYHQKIVMNFCFLMITSTLIAIFCGDMKSTKRETSLGSFCSWKTRNFLRVLFFL